MSDNFFGTTFGSSTPGHINLISGQTHGASPHTSILLITGKIYGLSLTAP